MTQPQY